MTPYTTFFPNIYVSAPEVPDPAVLSAVRDTCIDFCKQTNVWQVDLDPIDVVAGQPTYDLFAPAQTLVTQILGLAYYRRELHPRSETSLRLQERNWNDQPGEPHQFSRRPGDDLVILYPTPTHDAAAALTGTISVQPSRTSTSVIDDVYQRYLEPIVAGTLARLYLHVDTAYSNPAAVPMLNAQYQVAVNKARREIKLGYSPGPARVPRPKNH